MPEIRTRRGVFKLLRAWYVWFSEFFSLWPFEKEKKGKKKKGMKLINPVALTGSSLEILINTDMLHLPHGISPLFPFVVVD